MKKKILFLIPSLGGGGAERVLVNLVNNMDLEKYDITIETMFEGGVNEVFLDKRLHCICKNACCFKGVSRVYAYIPATVLYKYYIGDEKYDLLIAYRSGVATKVISGCGNEAVGKITWIHNGYIDKSSTYFKPWLRVKRALKIYSSMDAIASCAESAGRVFSQNTGIRNNVRTIYNTNDTDKIISLSNESVVFPYSSKDIINIFSAGRLEKIKGYDRLIITVIRLHNEGYRINLVIAGQGSEKEKLEALIEKNNANEYIHFVGFMENPYPLMTKADLFVSPSRQEGLSTVITEALILGVPVLSTDVSGAKEVLGETNEFGIVVENSEEGIYQGLKMLLSTTGLLATYKDRAVERGKDFVTSETVCQAEVLFDEVLKKNQDNEDRTIEYKLSNGVSKG